MQHVLHMFEVGLGGMWHTRIHSTIEEEDFVVLTKFFNDTNTREWNRKRALVLGFEEEDIRIAPGANVRLGTHGKLGKNVYIGISSYINGDIIIEDDVLIGPLCSLTSNSHLFNTENLNFRGKNSNRPITIGKGSWLSTGVVVNPGISIGKCNLVLPNTVVTKNTEDYAIIGGIPGRLYGQIDINNGTLLWASLDGSKEVLDQGELELDQGELNKFEAVIRKEDRQCSCEKRNTNNTNIIEVNRELSSKVILLERQVEHLESKVVKLELEVSEMNATFKEVSELIRELKATNNIIELNDITK